MPPQTASKTRISIDDYLAGERDAEVRHEYIEDVGVRSSTDADARHERQS